MKMKKMLSGLAITALVSSATTAYGAGFALYQGSAKGIAWGGAVMGRALDASANFYNPAAISDFTNTVITVGTGVEIPRTSVRVNGSNAGKMDPGTFLLPHAYIVQPLPYDFTFGLGFAPEYGLGTRYRDSWGLNWNTTETTVEGFVVNPNLAYRVTEDWSVSAGFRILYFSFDQYSRPLGQMSHVRGNNGFADWGWQASTKYDILDNLSVGVMYRSYIDTKVRGHHSWGNLAAGRAGSDIRLPQSISAGINWDVTDTVHLGYATTWTRWSSMDQIDFNLDGIPGNKKTTMLDWDDVFRFSFGAAWDFAEDWTLIGSYCYDMDPCSTKDDTGSTMLPAGDRHIINGGVAWTIGDVEISACYGLVLMMDESQTYHDSFNNAYRFSTKHGYSHQIGLTLTYRF